MIYTYEAADGKRAIRSSAAFVAALNTQPVLQLQSFTTVLEVAEALIREEYPRVTRAALSNVRGSWYEWLISIGMLEYLHNVGPTHLLLQLPNKSQYDCSQLYEESIFRYIQDLRTKLSNNADVKLITSNPDFVIVDYQIGIEFPEIPAEGVDELFIETLAHTYQQAHHSCSIDMVKGYVAVKFSLRPDRRLQIAHEGSLMKALYKHVQTREWIIDAPGIKYYAIASKATNADRDALKTVATHSIVDVSSKPNAAVDALYCVSSGDELVTALDIILAME